MKTITKRAAPAPTNPLSSADSRRPRFAISLVAVVALLLGLFGGWFAAAALDGDPEVIWVGGDELVVPDEATSTVTDEYVEAWKAGCGAFDP